MKRILITGKDSYIGTSVEKWLLKTPETYQVDTLDVKGEEWKNHDFSKYDVVFHVAGIAHVSTDPKMEDLYYKVNRDLTIEIAMISKDAGVKQFIFMSSIIVYGDSSASKRIITKDTIPTPTNCYGDSKLQAERGLLPLESESFRVVILRPPMIYGPNSKGNFSKLSKIAKITPIFPDYDNERSMLFIDNLSEYIRVIIDREKSGVFFPQNKEYVKTSELVRIISEQHSHKLIQTKLFNFIIFKLMVISFFRKMFGNLVYSKDIESIGFEDIDFISFKESIVLTEKIKK